MKRVAVLWLTGILTFAQPGPTWRSLIHRNSLDGWFWSTSANPPVPSWTVENGILRTTPDHGERLYLLTRESFSDFELEFEWKAEEGANSGIKYRFQGYWSDRQPTVEPSGGNRIEPIGLEYQIADDERHPDALKDDKHSTAALYEYWTASKAGPAKAGVWHQGRIIAKGTHIEHWLDGKLVVRIDLDSAEVQQAFATSSRRGSSPLLAKHERRSSPVALQFHDGVVWFRNLRIRELP